ncbi:MAG: hypothetical protein LQ339_003084 [Xanthoria mediterranea]|nr:MAG: hypothetical protein LQ339_003084 [Xanthoria mediterranea]
MRTISVPTLLALGLAVHQTAATAWTDAQTYSNPSNTNNQCVGEQSKGLGFEDHPTGDLGNYGALNWGNLRCTDGLQKRAFGPHGEDSHDKAPSDFAGGRCASGVASKDVDTSPKFSCGPEQKGMSIDHIHVSTSEKTDIELHYGYGNGVVCKQTATCSPAGNIIKNNQCGDAKTVTVKLPDTDTKDKCEIGIHSVGFNCGPASSKPPTPSSTPAEPKPVESTPLLSTSRETKPYPYPTPNTTTLIGSTAPPATIPSSISIPSTSTATLPIPSTTLESPTTPIYSNTSVSSTSPVETIPTVTPVSSTGPIETFPTTTSASSTSPLETVPTTTAPGTTVPLVTTEVIVTTLTTCPVTNTITSGSSTSVEITSTISTVFITSTSTVCTYCVAPPASTVETTNVPIDTSIVPEIPETTPIPSATGNSPETSSLSIPSPSSSVPAPVPTTTQAIITTDVVFTTLTTCPVTNTITSGDTTLVQTINTVSTITSTSTSTICTQCAPPADTFAPPPATTSPISPPAVATPASSTTANSPVGESSAPVIQPSSPAQASPSQAPPAQYPSVLPNCMKTWITITTCKDTTDSSCYCLDAAFTKTVQECVSAWAANNNDVQGALSNLAGICADHVSNNPGIITNVPKTITLVPTPASPAPSGPSSAPIVLPASSASITSAPSNAGGPPAVGTSVPSTVANSPVGGTIPPPAANPVTTLSLSQPVPYACPVSQLPDGQPQAPASSCTSLLVTQVIVPQVGFETVPAAPGVTNPSVDLVAGSPAPNPAVTTAGPVAGNGNSPATTFGTVVGSVSAIGSTFPQAPITPFTGSASNIKITGFGILAVVVGILFLI